VAAEVQVAVLEPGEGDADNIISKDVLGPRFVLHVLSVKVSVVLQVDVAVVLQVDVAVVLQVDVTVVLQVDVALSFSFLPGGSCITSLQI